MKKKRLLTIAIISLLLSVGQFVLPGLSETLASAGSFAMDAFVGEQQNVESPFVSRRPEVMKAVSLFRGNARPYFSRWLSNSGRYIGRIRIIFRSEGIPESLAYLALIESGYNNNAYSRAHAVGMWQFMSATGRGYGLRVGRFVDERRDFIRATRAAARFLKDLYRRFDDWYLALAAYNAGAGYIKARMAQTGATDFWTLAPHLYTETRLYVPRFLAACLIANNRETFGFKDLEMKAPFHFHRVTVKKRTTLAALALKNSVSIKAVRNVNPHIGTGIIPATAPGIGVNIPFRDRSSWRPLATLAGMIHGETEEDPGNGG